MKNKTFDEFYSDKRVSCSICGKRLNRSVKVNIRSSNPLHRYKGSGRPMVYTYNLKLCSKHFRKFNNILDKFIQE
jgi:superfamily I DNA and RNA helicase